MARKRLGEILVEAGVLDPDALRAALGEQRRWGGPLGQILVEMRLVSEEAMVRALAQQLNFPTVDLDATHVDPRALDLVSGELAEQHGVVPFAVQGKFLDVAMADPTNLGIIDELRIRTRLNVRPYLAGPKMIERAIQRYYGRGRGVPFDPRGGAVGVAAASPVGLPLRERMLEISTDHGRLRPARSTDSGVPSAGVASTPPVGANAPPAGVSGAAARRAQQFDFAAPDAARDTQVRDREILALQARVQQLEQLVARDEDVIRKLMALLIDKGIASREEILDRLNS